MERPFERRDRDGSATEEGQGRIPPSDPEHSATVRLGLHRGDRAGRDGQFTRRGVRDTSAEQQPFGERSGSAEDHIRVSGE